MLKMNSNCVFFFSCSVSQEPNSEVSVRVHVYVVRLLSKHHDGVCAKEWDLALFDFPGQTAEDLSFHKGAIIQVIEHTNAEWKRGRLEGREGLYPVAFTQPHKGTTHTHFITYSI